MQWQICRAETLPVRYQDPDLLSQNRILTVSSFFAVVNSSFLDGSDRRSFLLSLQNLFFRCFLLLSSMPSTHISLICMKVWSEGLTPAFHPLPYICPKIFFIKNFCRKFRNLWFSVVFAATIGESYQTTPAARRCI